MITSCGDAVGHALEQFLDLHKNGDVTAINVSYTGQDLAGEYISKGTAALCPDCGTTIEHIEGCLKCPSCGWSKC